MSPPPFMGGFTFGLGGRAGKGVFNPTSISNCRSWHRASLGVTDVGGKASAWADQSGAGDANRDLAQGTAGYRPTIVASDANFNGNATLDFDGTDDHMVSGTFSGGTYAQATTTYVVMRTDSTGASEFVFDSNDDAGAGATRQALILTSFGWWPYAGDSNIGGTIATATTYVIAIVWDGASSALYKSRYNTAEYAASFGSQGLHSLSVGARYDFTGVTFNGQIGEIITYSGAHGATTRQTVMEGLGALYGVTVTS